jgi:hypothetical protein
MENEKNQFRDYFSGYYKKIKTMQEMYVPEKGDVLAEMNEKFAIVKNGDLTKKVATEDYLTKSIQESMLLEAEYAQMTFIPTDAERKDLNDVASKMDESNKKISAALKAKNGDVVDSEIEKQKTLAKETIKKHDLDASNETKKAVSHGSYLGDNVHLPDDLARASKEKKADEGPQTRMEKYHGKK